MLYADCTSTRIIDYPQKGLWKISDNRHIVAVAPLPVTSKVTCCLKPFYLACLGNTAYIICLHMNRKAHVAG